jgi:GNAT superfamily N-acetyltransferase
LSLVVRPATPEDAAAAARLMRASIRALCEADHGGDPDRIAAWCTNKTAAHFRRWLAAPATRLFVAELDGHLAAVGAVSTSGEVTLNYVAPRARFRGASSALLARLEAELAGRGHAEARLESTTTAHGFYLARGWEDGGPPIRHRDLPGQPMRKRLG